MTRRPGARRPPGLAEGMVAHIAARSAVLLVAHLVASGLPAVAAEPALEPTCPSEAADRWETVRCAEPAVVARHAGVAARRGARLLLTLDDGRRVVLDDRLPEGGDETAIARHALIEALEAPRLFGIRTTFHEGGRTWVMSRASGRRWAVGGDALAASPDGRRVLAWGAADPHDDGALEVWRLDGDRLVLEFRGRTTDWWPSAARWVDARTVAFERVSEYDPAGGRGVPRRLVLDEGLPAARWRAVPAR